MPDPGADEPFPSRRISRKLADRREADTGGGGARPGLTSRRTSESGVPDSDSTTKSRSAFGGSPDTAETRRTSCACAATARSSKAVRCRRRSRSRACVRTAAARVRSRGGGPHAPPARPGPRGEEGQGEDPQVHGRGVQTARTMSAPRLRGSLLPGRTWRSGWKRSRRSSSRSKARGIAGDDSHLERELAAVGERDAGPAARRAGSVRPTATTRAEGASVVRRACRETALAGPPPRTSSVRSRALGRVHLRLHLGQARPRPPPGVGGESGPSGEESEHEGAATSARSRARGGGAGSSRNRARSREEPSQPGGLSRSRRLDGPSRLHGKPRRGSARARSCGLRPRERHAGTRPVAEEAGRCAPLPRKALALARRQDRAAVGG